MSLHLTAAAAVVFAVALSFNQHCSAGERVDQSIAQALAGNALPVSELSKQAARGLNNFSVDSTFNVDGALSDGSLHGNSVIGTSTTGTITTSNSINNNTGITTVFQNSGNNSLFQQTTSIAISVH